MFIASLFYGYRGKGRKEKKIGEERIQALREIEMAITSSLDLRPSRRPLERSMSFFLCRLTVTLGIKNWRVGARCLRNLDESEWKAVIARRIRLDKISEHDHAPV